MITESAFAQNLALLPLPLSDWFEQGAYWLLLLFALTCGFALAWALQAARCRRMVQRLWAVHQRQHLEQQEEARLLAEDLAQEQACQLAYQARRISQMKTLLRQQHRRAALSAHPGASAAMPPIRTAPAAAQTGQTAARERLLPEQPARAPSSATPSASPSHTAAASRARPALVIETGNTARGSTAAARAPRQHSQRHAPLTQIRRDQGMGDAAALVLKRRLALELRISREKARLMRQYEAEAQRWQQAHRASQAQVQTLQAAMASLEKALEETRQTWAAAEREVERLKEQLHQKPASGALLDLTFKRATSRNDGSDSSFEQEQRSYPMLAVARQLLAAHRKDARAGHLR